MEQRVLFIDIETAGYFSKKEFLDFTENNENYQYKKVWLKKWEKYGGRDIEPVNFYCNEVALYPEYASIITISMGYWDFDKNQENSTFRVCVIGGMDEKKILTTFYDIYLGCAEKDYILCGYNIKSFDLPFIIKRVIINRLLKKFSNLTRERMEVAKKNGLNWPFNRAFVIHENIIEEKDLAKNFNIIDVMDLWHFTGERRKSLEDLALAFRIMNPKEDTFGKEIPEIYHKIRDTSNPSMKRELWGKIINYCIKDVITTANIYYLFYGEDQIMCLWDKGEDLLSIDDSLDSDFFVVKMGIKSTSKNK